MYSGFVVNLYAFYEILNQVTNLVTLRIYGMCGSSGQGYLMTEALKISGNLWLYYKF